MNRQLSRRSFLRGTGISLALPLLDAMLPSTLSAADEMTTPVRMAFLYVPNGVNIAQWTPQGEGRDWQPSTTLQPLADLKQDINVLTGLGHPNSKGGHSGADTWLTGANLAGTPGYDYRNSISADQVAAEVVGLKTRVPSLELSANNGTGSPGHSHTLSFSRSAVPLPAESDPRLVFERLFVDETGDTRKAKLQRFEEDKSILDLVINEANSLNRKLGKADQRKLDEYLTSIREVERRVKRAESWMDIPKPKIDGSNLKLDAKAHSARGRREYFRTMYDLMFLAFQSDVTRISAFTIGREAGGGRFAEIGINAVHHELSHHGGDQGMLAQLAQIDKFHIENLAYFLNRLKSTKEGDATVLDRTMIMYGSGMNSGTGGGHSPKNLPLLFAGGSALGIKQGQHLKNDVDSSPLSNVLLTMLQKIQLPHESFMDSTGTLTGLT